MWCVLILNLLVYSYPIYKAITFKPSAYKIKYDDFVKRSDGIYDDNGIMCGKLRLIRLLNRVADIDEMKLGKLKHYLNLLTQAKTEEEFNEILNNAKEKE